MTESLTLLAQQPHMPTADSMYWIMLLSRISHILGAIILTGGLFYIRLVVSPPGTTTNNRSADEFFGGSRAAWAKWVGIATALLLFSGLWNYVQFMKAYELAPKYHMILGIKIIAAIAVFLLAALLAGRTNAAEAIRQKWGMWINICLLLAIVTVVLGSVCRTFPHDSKPNAAEAPKLVAPAN